MSDLERRPRGHMTRRQREQRVLRLMVVGSLSGIVGAVGIVLAIAGVVGAGIPILLLLVALACALVVRRTLGR
jgi:hypothetical protein